MNKQAPAAASRFGPVRRFALLLGGIFVVAILAVLAGERWSFATARAEAQRAAVTTSISNRGLLSSELQKYRLLPLVLAEYPDVVTALADPSAQSAATANRTLELLAGRTDAAVIYLVNRQGKTIAASNWRLPSSFVGQNYGFRPYFATSLSMGAAEQFALGTVSKRPGLFLARRVSGGAGVIVVKVEFDRLERSWTHQPGATIVRDENGVVIISSRPAWRFRATRPIPPFLVPRLRKARQYGDHAVQPLAADLALPEAPSTLATGADGKKYETATSAAPVAGWTLTSLEPLAPALGGAKARARAAVLTLLLLLLIGVGAVTRAREKRQLQVAARRALEEEVRRRTAELSEANKSLKHESAERERNQARLRAAREELAQASRLGTLGQITAGVAHELNQPVAAIRTFAENAAVMNARENRDGVERNLGQIVDLTKRIGQITSELRLFARRDHSLGPVALAEAVDGALLLMNERIAGQAIAVDRDEVPADLRITGDRVRLEQTFINLLQNAADALAGTADPLIRIGCEVRQGDVLVTFTDNGPGVAPHLADRLFTPFTTGKADGLGLGLVISRDIVRSFGGELSFESSPSGTAFTILLRKA
ncbi:MAG: two-component system, NtrC family, C4-dicarboxylate transport sensor histidine kinase DctB [Sphingomonadales bacterium]|nr:two-component system, NtrC family, C4-dicarboxylate transport sensor histidine kinase DctB [Sphingomonadales bacterium]